MWQKAVSWSPCLTWSPVGTRWSGRCSTLRAPSSSASPLELCLLSGLGSQAPRGAELGTREATQDTAHRWAVRSSPACRDTCLVASEAIGPVHPFSGVPWEEPACPRDSGVPCSVCAHSEGPPQAGGRAPTYEERCVERVSRKEMASGGSPGVWAGASPAPVPLFHWSVLEVLEDSIAWSVRQFWLQVCLSQGGVKPSSCPVSALPVRWHCGEWGSLMSPLLTEQRPGWLRWAPELSCMDQCLWHCGTLNLGNPAGSRGAVVGADS